MCGRARLSSDVSEIKLVFSIPPHRPTPNIAPSWNVAPTDPLPVVRYDPRAGERSLDVMRWELAQRYGASTAVLRLARAARMLRVRGPGCRFVASRTEKR
jgi:putative SOS response-associated peptidase YedK